MKPRAQEIRTAKPVCLAGQDQEGGLEGILGGVRLVQHAPADAEDHRAMPAHQGRERRLAFGRITSQESIQQLPVAQAGERPHVPEDLERFQRCPGL